MVRGSGCVVRPVLCVASTLKREFQTQCFLLVVIDVVVVVFLFESRIMQVVVGVDDFFFYQPRPRH